MLPVCYGMYACGMLVVYSYAVSPVTNGKERGEIVTCRMAMLGHFAFDTAGT